MTEMYIVEPAGKGYNHPSIFTQPSSCQHNPLISVRCRWMSQTTDNNLSVLMRAGLNGDQISYRKFLQGIMPFIRRQIDRVMPYGVAAEKDDIAQDVLFAFIRNVTLGGSINLYCLGSGQFHATAPLIICAG